MQVKHKQREVVQELMGNGQEGALGPCLGIEAYKNCMALHYRLSTRRVLWPGSHLSQLYELGSLSKQSQSFTCIQVAD